MKKKVAVALCGILIFTMLLPGCGSAGAQAGGQDVPEQVSDVKPQDEAEEREKLSTVRDGQPDAAKEAVTDKAAADKAAKDSASVKTDAAKTQEDKADTKTVDNGSEAGSTSSGSSQADSSSGNASAGNSAGNTSSGSNGSESGTSGSSADTGNISNGAGTIQPEHSHSEHTQPEHSQPEHTHSWVEQTTTVTHEAAGHYETVVVKDAWDEPVYEIQVRSICNVCGQDVTGNAAEHAKAHALAGEGGGHHTEPIQVQTGTIRHEAVTEQVWVEDSPAYEETVGTGSYICSACGATK